MIRTGRVGLGLGAVPGVLRRDYRDGQDPIVVGWRIVGQTELPPGPGGQSPEHIAASGLAIHSAPILAAVWWLHRALLWLSHQSLVSLLQGACHAAGRRHLIDAADDFPSSAMKLRKQSSARRKGVTSPINQSRCEPKPNWFNADFLP
jgi:hypothetical protein